MSTPTTTRTAVRPPADLVADARRTVAVVEWNTAHGRDGTSAQALCLEQRREALTAAETAGHPDLVPLLRAERRARQQLRSALDDPRGAEEGTDELDERLAELQRARAATADYVAHPRTSGTQEIIDKIVAVRRAEAEAAHAQYPQYAGHWDGWELVEITGAVIRAKGDVLCFARGDLVLRKPESQVVRGIGAHLSTHVTCYSGRTHIDTSVPVSLVREVLVTG